MFDISFSCINSGGLIFTFVIIHLDLIAYYYLSLFCLPATWPPSPFLSLSNGARNFLGCYGYLHFVFNLLMIWRSHWQLYHYREQTIQSRSQDETLDNRLRQDFCPSCEMLKRNGTSHCGLCGICVPGRDHHCFFVGCCIRTDSARYFMGLLVCSMLSCLVLIVLIFHYVLFSSTYHVVGGGSGGGDEFVVRWFHFFLPVTLFSFLGRSMPVSVFLWSLLVNINLSCFLSCSLIFVIELFCLFTNNGMHNLMKNLKGRPVFANCSCNHWLSNFGQLPSSRSSCLSKVLSPVVAIFALILFPILLLFRNYQKHKSEKMDEGLNLTNGTTNGTDTEPPPVHGIATAYLSLLLMAVVPIYVGSWRSIRKTPTRSEERITKRDAALFPIYASCALFTIYLIFRMLSKEYLNILLSCYFSLIGALAVFHAVRQWAVARMPGFVPNKKFLFTLSEFVESTETSPAQDAVASSSGAAATDNPAPKPVELIKEKFSQHDVIVLIFCLVFGVWYFLKKHWIANNIIGFCFCIDAIELVKLDNIQTGCLLLGGLFVYDVFWVFGTDVMVSVATSFDAPIKLLFPQDLPTKGLYAEKFAMLGLGDIVIPGIFIAVLLRYGIRGGSPPSSGSDQGDGDPAEPRMPPSQFLFGVGMFAYILGLVTTITILHVFKHAQPALLYLVPSCIGLPLAAAACSGQLKHLLSYQEVPPSTKEDERVGGLFDPILQLFGLAPSANKDKDA